MNILDMIKSQLGDSRVEEMGGHLGESKENTMGALASAIPVLVGAMARNSKSEEGANALAGALDRDHDGSIMDNLGGLFSKPEESQGNGILKHLLGGRREATESAVAEKSGISLASAGKLLTIAAPIIMGMLGKKKREEGMDAGALGSLLGMASATHENEPDEGGSGIGGMVKGLLDRDGDGNIMDDIGGLIGGFLGGR